MTEYKVQSLKELEAEMRAVARGEKSANERYARGMDIIDTALPDVKIVLPQRISDDRGSLTEFFNARALADAGITATFVQDNLAHNRAPGTVRGLHYQIDPMAQGKLVCVIRGIIFDVAVDIRPTSPTFARHATATLSAANGRQLWIPPGHAHGYCTLLPNTRVFYKVTNYYSPPHERGINPFDPALSIPWPVNPKTATISERDQSLPLLKDLPGEPP